MPNCSDMSKTYPAVKVYIFEWKSNRFATCEGRSSGVAIFQWNGVGFVFFNEKVARYPIEWETIASFTVSNQKVAN